jgi:hypothetical protein
MHSAKLSMHRRILIYTAFSLLITACSSDFTDWRKEPRAQRIRFDPEVSLGTQRLNPAAPFLRFAPNGRLFAVWTEDEPDQLSTSRPAMHHQPGKMRLSPLRAALVSSSSDGGKTWSSPQRVNNGREAIQGEENGPRLAFDADSQVYVVWSIPGEQGDITRANIRFAMENSQGHFSEARTLNEVKDAARFPIIKFSPTGHLVVAWIDRRIDYPTPRQLYLMQIATNGQALTKNYQVGEGLCECCKLGMVFADGGRTIYIVNRQVDEKQIRNHVLCRSTNGGASFAAPVQISDDGWQVPSCPHSGPSIVRDSRGWLHVSWFTLGRSEKEAGIYYSVSKDNSKTFAPRQLVQANTAPEVLYTNIAVGDDDTVYLVWSNLDGNNRSQIFMRTIDADGRTWGPIQQISNAAGNASRAVMALRKNELLVAWTETDGESSRAVVRRAMVGS